MRDVAARAGVSQPFLSDLENGRAMPSITTLYRLADTFGLTPQDLLPSILRDDVVVGRAADVEPGPVDVDPGVALALMVAGGHGRMLEVRRYQLAPDLPPGDFYEHEGEDLILLLDGALRVEFDTGSEKRLAAGDTIWLSGLLPHRWRSEPGCGAELLLVKARLPATGSNGDHN